jgi:uncharacterized Fe-S cluster-containing radical SAM superfamily protein
MLQPLKNAANRLTWLKFARQHLAAVRLRRTHPEGIVPPVPKRVVVEPTNACNLRCAYCGNKDMLRPRTFLDLGLYERLLDEMVELGIPRLTLHTIGEPTLHPRIGEMVAMATERGRVVTLSTNGTLLGRGDLARSLVRGGPDLLNVSADAADAETLAKTRDGLRPEVVLEGLRLLRRLRDEEGPIRDSPWGRVRLPTITLTCVVTDLFTREVERKFFEAYAPLVDDFLFHFPNSHADYVPDRTFDRGGFLPRALRDRLYKAVRYPCYYPWDALFLLSDGTMSVCRFDFDARVRIGRYGPESIQELWHGEAMSSLRRAHMSFDFKDWTTCESCTAVWYENRSEHIAMSRKLMARNGVKFVRDAWLPENPRRIRMASEGARGFEGAARPGARPAPKSV